jgi:ATP-binding cassette subfamily F protein 3
VAEVGTIRSFLARFGYTGEDCFKLVAALSGGEKTKLSLARLLYHPANFIIFDEPTNHLDLDSREALEQALKDYEGSCLIVTHDRYFLNQVVSRILYLNNGNLTVYEGNYAYFREKTTVTEIPVKVKDPRQKTAYLSFKEKSKRVSRHKRKVQDTRSKIADLEQELHQLEEDIHSNIPKTAWEQLHDASERKRQVEEEILALYATLEKLENTHLD